ncbi:MAG: hypothetical protein ACPHLL_03100 [Porticoccaceae bacterium]
MTRAALVLTMLLAGNATATELYRYYNSAGMLVTADTIPPLAAADGYEILNAQGQVLRVVKTQAPIGKDAETSALDQYLLASFTSVDEVSERKQRKLKPLISEIANLRRSLSTVVETEQQLSAQAASSEMLGHSVSPELVQQIERKKRERAEWARLLAERQGDLAAIEALYHSYEQRLAKLLHADP